MVWYGNMLVYVSYVLRISLYIVVCVCVSASLCLHLCVSMCLCATGGVLVLNLGIGFLVPDVPEQVTIQQDRNKMIVNKVFHNVPDDDDESLSATLRADLDIVIRLTDDDPL
jgi:hypothetical protein